MARMADPAGRERILRAATTLFYVHGVRAVGMAEVIAEAGCGKNMLYRHFPSKAALAAAYLTRARAERDRAVAEALAHVGQTRTATRGPFGPAGETAPGGAAGRAVPGAVSETPSRAGSETPSRAEESATTPAPAGFEAGPAGAALVALVAEVAAWVRRAEFRGCAFRNYLTEFPDGDDEPADVARAYLRDTRSLIGDLVAALGAPPLLADRLWLLIDALYAGTGTNPQVAVDWAHELVTAASAGAG